MYGGMKAPLLLPKYATDYISHKEVVRQIFLNGFRSHLFYLKKVFYPPLPFYVGSYKFTKVKNAPKFVKELENFHFGEKDFHQNDSQGKVAAYKEALKVNFEYIDYVDKEEERYKNIYSLTAVNKKMKLKSIAVGDKSNGSKTLVSKIQEEEAAKKAKEETTQRITQG